MAAREWQHTHQWPADLGEFARDILPGIAEVPARVLAEATGLSFGYCGRIKAGGVVPHPMWWERLRELGLAARPSGRVGGLTQNPRLDAGAIVTP